MPIELSKRGGSALVAMATAAIALAGCGGSSQTTAQVKQTLSSYQQALRTHNGAKACRLMTSAGRAELARIAQAQKLGDSCADYLARRQVASRAPRAVMTVVSVHVSGNRATAALNDRLKPVGRSKMVTFNACAGLEKVDGKWLVDPTRPPTAHPTATLFKQGDTLASVIAHRFSRAASSCP